MASSEPLVCTEETRTAAALGGKKGDKNIHEEADRHTQTHTDANTQTHTRGGTPADNEAIKQINKTLKEKKNIN